MTDEHSIDEPKQVSLKGWQLKVLMLSWEYPPNAVGGLSRHVYGLALYLAKLGHEVHVLTAGNSALPGFERIEGVNVHRVKPINEQDESFLAWIGGLNLAMSYAAENLAKKVKFDLIHGHDWLIGSAAIYLKESFHVPLLATIHATEHGRNNGLHNDMQHFIHQQEQQLVFAADQLIVCSDYMKDTVQSIFNAKNVKIAVIPNGMEEPEPERALGELFPELKQKKYIFSVGRMVPEKGFDTILETAALVKEKGLDFYFVIAGKGPMLETYQRAAGEQNLENYVAFIGYITDEQKFALISGCELAVFPSLYEPFGIVVLETMVRGKPTIVSNTGGMKGIVQNGQTGLVMEPGDSNGLLEKIELLVNNPQFAQEIGTKGRKTAKGLYGWNIIALNTSRLMENMVLSNRVSLQGQQ